MLQLPLRPCSSLPLAFYGKFDSVDIVKAVWSDVWNEHPAMEEATIRIYLREIVEIVQPRLVERSWEVKRQVRWGRVSGELDDS